MKQCKTEQEYLDQIIEPVRRCCKRYGYLPSVLIAQSCLENGYGIPADTRVLVEANNMVGIKRELLNKSWVDIGLSVWQGGYITKMTPEQYGDEIHTIQDDFRTYDCIERSFADYLCFMTYASNYGAGGEPKYGSKVLTITDPNRLIRTVSMLGYATGQTYPNSVMRIVNKYDLTRFDDLTGVEPTAYVPDTDSITINPNPSFEPTHNTSARSWDIEYIVLHYVGALGDAKANIDYYNQPTTTEASADFYVGHTGDIWQYNMKPEKRYCWAVGGGRQTAYGGTLLGIATNKNSISIEMCVKNSTGRSQIANSPTWYFEPVTIDSAVRLTRHLMSKYGIPYSHVIRHYDVNGKLCPGVVGWNDASGDDSAWRAFKARIMDGSVPDMPEPSKPASDVKYRVQVGAYKRKSNAKNKASAVEFTTGFSCFIEQDTDEQYKVYCGSFEIEENAQNRCDKLKTYGIDCFVKEVSA